MSGEFTPRGDYDADPYRGLAPDESRPKAVGGGPPGVASLGGVGGIDRQGLAMFDTPSEFRDVPTEETFVAPSASPPPEPDGGPRGESGGESGGGPNGQNPQSEEQPAAADDDESADRPQGTTEQGPPDGCAGDQQEALSERGTGAAPPAMRQPLSALSRTLASAPVVAAPRPPCSPPTPAQESPLEVSRNGPPPFAAAPSSPPPSVAEGYRPVKVLDMRDPPPSSPQSPASRAPAPDTYDPRKVRPEDPAAAYAQVGPRDPPAQPPPSSGPSHGSYASGASYGTARPAPLPGDVSDGHYAMPLGIHGPAQRVWIPPTRRQPWTTRLCSCCNDCASVYDMVMCFPCQVARQCNAAEGLPNLHSCGYCTLALCLWPLSLPIAAHAVRSMVVRRYNIDEGDCRVCAMGFLLPLNSLCQTHRELSYRGLWPGGTCFQTLTPPVPPREFTIR